MLAYTWNITIRRFSLFQLVLWHAQGATFLQKNDLSGKKVHLFCSYRTEAWLGAYRLLRRRHPMRSYRIMCLTALRKTPL